jgi:hypothetical protein
MRLVAITHNNQTEIVEDYRAVNHGTKMNPEMYLDVVKVEGTWYKVDTFKEVTFKKIEQ